MKKIIIELSEAQFFALREFCVSIPDFTLKGNKELDRLNSIILPGSYNDDLKSLWIRYKEYVTKDNYWVPDKEIEKIIKFNLGAFLYNLFFAFFIQGQMSESIFHVEDIKNFMHHERRNPNT